MSEQTLAIVLSKRTPKRPISSSYASIEKDKIVVDPSKEPAGFLSVGMYSGVKRTNAGSTEDREGPLGSLREE
jgi:hypothetical protein